MKTYKLNIEILTPIHIGDGTDVEPYEYVIDDMFYKIDLSKFLLGLQKEEQDEFNKLLEESLIKCRAFIKEHFRNKDCVLYKSNVSDSIKAFYQGKIHDPRNQLIVSPFIRGTNISPYIPGSSLKGSLRTALIYALFEEKHVTKKTRGDVLEADLLDCQRGWLDNRNRVFVTNGLNAQKDPFRAFKTVDIILPEGVTTIQKLETVISKQSVEPLGIQLIKEVTNSEFTNNPLCLDTEIRLDDMLLNKNRDMKFKISVEDVVTSCKEFSKDVIDNELGRYFRKKDNGYSAYSKLRDIWSSLKENEFMFRLGQGSGYNSTTMNLKRKYYKDIKNVKTRKMIDEVIPLGWIKGSFPAESLKFKPKPKKEASPKKIVKREAPPIVMEQWDGVTLEFKPGSGELIAHGENNVKAYACRDEAKTIKDSLEDTLLKRLKKKKVLKNISVVVRKEGTSIFLVGIVFRKMKKIFISYSRDDLDEVEQLVSELKLRGLKTWHDVKDLGLENTSEGNIKHALESECDAVIVYLTQNVIDKPDFVIGVELKAALKCTGMSIVPVFRGISTEAAKNLSISKIGQDVTVHNGVEISNSDDFSAKLSEAARKVLKAHLDKYSSNDPLNINVRTFEHGWSGDSSMLELDWGGYFDKPKPPSKKAWNDTLLPALDDVTSCLSGRFGDTSTFYVKQKAKLSVSFALGFSFRLKQHLDFEQINRETGNVEVYSTRGTTKDTAPLEKNCISGDITSKDVSIELSVTKDITEDVNNFIKDRKKGFRARMQLSLPRHGRSGVQNSQHALDIARQVEKVISSVYSDYNVGTIHIFASIPSGVALLIGYQLNACGKIQCYDEWRKNYYPACLLK